MSQIIIRAMTLAILVSTVVVTTVPQLAKSERGRRRNADKTIEKVLAEVTVGSAQELARATDAEFLILHIDVDWSLTAVQSRQVIAKLKSKLENDSAYRHVLFRRVDCTEQAGPIWDALRQWLEKNHGDVPHVKGVRYGGTGSLVWVRAGKVVGLVGYAATENIDGLLARTRAVMSAK